jgi:predicted RNase H-like HicB family nuclease
MQTKLNYAPPASLPKRRTARERTVDALVGSTQILAGLIYAGIVFVLTLDGPYFGRVDRPLDLIPIGIVRIVKGRESQALNRKVEERVLEMRKITFVVTEDKSDGGYTARSHWPVGNRDLFTQGDTREELVRNVREVVDVTFGKETAGPHLIHLRHVAG